MFIYKNITEMKGKKHKSLGNQILELIRHIKQGQVLFASDYVYLANAEAVNMAFSRLAKTDQLKRLGKGIYIYPQHDPELGVLYPSLEKIAEAIAKKEKVRIRPTGAYALNRLGISTQVPMKVIYLTDGNSRNIKVGKGTLAFKHTTPKKLATEGQITFLAIQALLELGKESIDEKVIKRLTEVLQKEGPEIVIKDAKLAPGWVAKILYSIAIKMRSND
jgi:uncharacterized protein DUF6088